MHPCLWCVLNLGEIGSAKEANLLLNTASEVDLGLYDQANKRIRRMPWQSEAKKDVAACEKLWGVGNER